MYEPRPFDSGDVNLPAELTALTEQMAENVHEVWAQGRIREGWTYGDIEDPKAKVSPLLIPYCKLPESEKNYDRNTAMEILKLITALGYEIRKM